MPHRKPLVPHRSRLFAVLLRFCSTHYKWVPSQWGEPSPPRKGGKGGIAPRGVPPATCWTGLSPALCRRHRFARPSLSVLHDGSPSRLTCMTFMLVGRARSMCLSNASSLSGGSGTWDPGPGMLGGRRHDTPEELPGDEPKLSSLAALAMSPDSTLQAHPP